MTVVAQIRNLNNPQPQQTSRSGLVLSQRHNRIMKNQRGVALLMALFAICDVDFLAVEVAYDTSVEYQVSASR